MADLGLSVAQVDYAQTIIAEGHKMGMTRADIETAIMVALDESNLQNYANTKVPESMKIAHDAIGMDGYSVGIFQQQVGIWGTAAELMNPVTSTDKFYAALAAVPGRHTMTLPQAAQTVQRSADPTGTNYLLKQPEAARIVAALDAGSGATATDAGTATGAPGGNWFTMKGGWQRVGIFALGAVILAIAYGYLVGDSETFKSLSKAAVKVAVVA